MLLRVLLACLLLSSFAHAADEATPADKPVEQQSATTEKSTDDGPKPAEKPKLKLAGITLKGSYHEGAEQPGVFEEAAPHLSRLIKNIDNAAADDKVIGILLNFQSPDFGRGKIDELRAAIARARKAGKKVYANLEDAESGDYLVAAACDEIIMPPAGTLGITGVRAEVMFYKGLLEKLGLKADMLQVGDYKGAAEPLMRDSMSKEFRAQLETVIDDYYDQLVGMVAADRKLDRGIVKDLVDEGLFTAARAKKVGLVDRVQYLDEFRAALAKQKDAAEVTLVADYGKQEVDTDFSGFTGFIKMFELLAGVEPRTRSTATKKVAIIYAVGAITTGEGGASLLGGSVVGSDTIIKALREAEKDAKVAAIVLRIDSPGGSGLASDLMWREIVRIKASKPIVASMGDTAASGGYYIAMGCNQIFAEPGTLTGSIGVVGGKVAMKGLYEKLGLTTEVISRGKNSGWLSSDAPFSESEREVVSRLMKDLYKQFTEKAAQGRKLELKDLEALAGGRVYSGRMAKQNKLIDELGTLEDAVAAAKKLGGIPAEEKIDRLILPKPKTFFEELLGGGLVSSSVKAHAPDILQQVQQATQLQHLLREPAVLTMPHGVQIR